MTKEFLFEFIRQHKLAVVSTISPGNFSQSALVGIAVTENLEIIFDTVKNSRKYKNISVNRTVSVVIGWENETTVQYEGEATELAGENADHFREIYFSAFPDGRERFEKWEGLVHFKISPKWIRYSNFDAPQEIQEMNF